MKPELTDDEIRVLTYLYRCEEAGTRPNVYAMDMSVERALAALEHLKELGFVEQT